jgi:hypothetical protein
LQVLRVAGFMRMWYAIRQSDGLICVIVTVEVQIGKEKRPVLARTCSYNSASVPGKVGQLQIIECATVKPISNSTRQRLLFVN